MASPDYTTGRAQTEATARTLADESNGQKSLPFKLTGSQAKTAYSIRQNCERMICGGATPELVASRTDGEKFIPAHYRCAEPEFLTATGFLTLTLGDYHCAEHGKQIPNDHERQDCCSLCGNRMKFQQVFDAKEASRRFNNLNRRVLKDLFLRAIVVTERHKNKAIHFHLVGVLGGAPDIRTGFSFVALEAAKDARASGRRDDGAETRYKQAASEELRGLWKMLRETLPKYGFGRAELTPIRATGEAVACYISKYIEKNICNRLKEDKRKKLVRYVGDWKVAKEIETLEELLEKGIEPEKPGDYFESKIGCKISERWSKAPYKIRPNDFAWGSKRAIAWRGKAKQTAGLIGIESPEDAKAALGPRWAFHLSTTWQGRTVDDLQPFLIADWQTCRLLTDDLAKLSMMKSPGWLKREETPMQPWLSGEDVWPGFVGTIYRKPSAEPEPDFDAELSQAFEVGWKKFKEIESERLAKFLEPAALN